MAQQIRLTKPNKAGIKDLKRDANWNLLSENKVGNLAIEQGVKVLRRKFVASLKK